MSTHGTATEERTHFGGDLEQPVTAAYLAECEAEAEAAGPAPFTVRHGDHGVRVLDGDGDPVGYLVGGRICFPDATGVFFASARQRVPVLVAEVRRLQRLVAEARGNYLAMGNPGDPFQNHPVHPSYGPCDGIAPGGMCSVCLVTIKRLDAASADLRRQTDASAPAPPSPVKDQSPSTIGGPLLVTRACAFAFDAHEGQTYSSSAGDRPYSDHLADVVAVLLQFGHKDPVVLAAGYLQDVLEDTPTTWEGLSRAVGDEVASLVDKVTDAPGKNRRERKARTYPKTRSDPRAVLVKLADRIANAENAARTGHLLNMYRKEHAAFEAALRRPGEFHGMWEHLAFVLATTPPVQGPFPSEVPG